MRAVGPRDDKVYCGATDTNARYGNASVCTGKAPLALDLEFAYGIATHIELLTELRIGLEKDFGSTPSADDGSRPFHLAPGARFFFSESAHAKFFVQPMIVFDVADYKTTTGSRGTEWGARALQGFWLDLHRAYGFYVFIGESAEVSPWIIAEFEGGIGFQGRYP